MSVGRRKKTSKAPPRGRSAREVLTEWYVGKRPVFVFGLKFAGVLALLYVVSLAPFWERVQDGYLSALARLAGGLLRGVGEENQLTGATIWSLKYSVTVGPECAATQFAWFLAGAMVAFPAAWSHRVAGLLAGVVLLAGLNVIRVGSLYLVGAHVPAAFVTVHEDVWPSVMVLATVCVMAGWIGWTRRVESMHDCAAP
jgi:exosortase/archaeosortase family protein